MLVRDSADGSTERALKAAGVHHIDRDFTGFSRRLNRESTERQADRILLERKEQDSADGSTERALKVSRRAH